MRQTTRWIWRKSRRRSQRRPTFGNKENIPMKITWRSTVLQNRIMQNLRNESATACLTYLTCVQHTVTTLKFWSTKRSITYDYARGKHVLDLYFFLKFDISLIISIWWINKLTANINVILWFIEIVIKSCIIWYCEENVSKLRIYLYFHL